MRPHLDSVSQPDVHGDALWLAILVKVQVLPFLARALRVVGAALVTEVFLTASPAAGQLRPLRQVLNHSLSLRHERPNVWWPAQVTREKFIYMVFQALGRLLVGLVATFIIYRSGGRATWRK